MAFLALRLLSERPSTEWVLETSSLAWGLAAEALLVLAYFPCLSPVDWFNLVFSALGVLFSIYALVRSRARTGNSIVGFVFCVMVLSVSVIRLVIGAATL